MNSYQNYELLCRIADDIIYGYNYKDIKKKLENDQYEPFKTSNKTRERQWQYYKEATALLKVEFDEEKKELRNVLYERYLSLYKTCVSRNEMNTALNSLKEMAKLMGLNEADKIDITSNNNIVIDFSFDNANSEDESQNDGNAEESVEVAKQ